MSWGLPWRITMGEVNPFHIVEGSCFLPAKHEAYWMSCVTNLSLISSLEISSHPLKNLLPRLKDPWAAPYKPEGISQEGNSTPQSVHEWKRFLHRFGEGEESWLLSSLLISSSFRENQVYFKSECLEIRWTLKYSSLQMAGFRVFYKAFLGVSL